MKRKLIFYISLLLVVQIAWVSLAFPDAALITASGFLKAFAPLFAFSRLTRADTYFTSLESLAGFLSGINPVEYISKYGYFAYKTYRDFFTGNQGEWSWEYNWSPFEGLGDIADTFFTGGFSDHGGQLAFRNTDPPPGYTFNIPIKGGGTHRNTGGGLVELPSGGGSGTGESALGTGPEMTTPQLSPAKILGTVDQISMTAAYFKREFTDEDTYDLRDILTKDLGFTSNDFRQGIPAAAVNTSGSGGSSPQQEGGGDEGGGKVPHTPLK